MENEAERVPLANSGSIKCGDMVHVFGNTCYRIKVQMYGETEADGEEEDGIASGERRTAAPFHMVCSLTFLF
jgi:hypothetical protein